MLQSNRPITSIVVNPSLVVVYYGKSLQALPTLYFAKKHFTSFRAIQAKIIGQLLSKHNLCPLLTALAELSSIRGKIWGFCCLICHKINVGYIIYVGYNQHRCSTLFPLYFYNRGGDRYIFQPHKSLLWLIFDTILVKKPDYSEL